MRDLKLTEELIRLMEVVRDLEPHATTTEVNEEHHERHRKTLTFSRSYLGRNAVYRRLSKLEAAGYLDKVINFGATSIGHAFWSLTEQGKEALAQPRDQERDRG